MFSNIIAIKTYQFHYHSNHKNTKKIGFNLSKHAFQHLPIAISKVFLEIYLRDTCFHFLTNQIAVFKSNTRPSKTITDVLNARSPRSAGN